MDYVIIALLVVVGVGLWRLMVRFYDFTQKQDKEWAWWTRAVETLAGRAQLDSVSLALDSLRADLLREPVETGNPLNVRLPGALVKIKQRLDEIGEDVEEMQTNMKRDTVAIIGNVRRCKCYPPKPKVAVPRKKARK